MFGLDDKYKVNKKIPMSSLIPKDLKVTDRKKLKENIKSCSLAYQIMGEVIPSIVNSQYNYQVIQFYDFEIIDIRKANFIGNLYQEIIKSPCVLRLFTESEEVYFFSLKKLNYNDKTQVVIQDSFMSNNYSSSMSSLEKEEFFSYLDYNKILNKSNKVTFYLEMYVKAYILTKNKVYASSNKFLERNDIWYNEEKIEKLYETLRSIEILKFNLQKASSNSEKIKINKEIKNHIGILEGENEN